MPALVSDAALRADAERELTLDPASGFARVAPGEEPDGLLSPCRSARASAAPSLRTVVDVERRLTGLPANTVRSEQPTHVLSLCRRAGPLCGLPQHCLGRVATRPDWRGGYRAARGLMRR